MTVKVVLTNLSAEVPEVAVEVPLGKLITTVI